MSLNCNEINLVLSELNLNGSFIQEIIQTGFDTLVLRCIKGGDLVNLLICTSPQGCRINITKFKPVKNKKPLRFNEFLKSRVQGMRINSIEQLGLDRIVRIDASTWKERIFLYVRLWSNAANVIAVDEQNKILDCMFRRPKKNEITGADFIIEEKIPTEEERKASLERFAVREYNSEEKTFNQFIDEYYSEHVSALSRESLLEKAEKWYNSKHSKMESALQNLMEKKVQFENAGTLKHAGDLLLSCGMEVNGSTVTCTDYETGKEIHIRVDPKLNIHQNAAVYYDQYKKSVSGMEALLHDIELSQKAIAQLDAQYNSILNEQNVLKIEQMIRTNTQPKQQDTKNRTGLHYEVNGWTIIVGRTANENDELLRHTVKGQDMWLHTRDYAGGYVFIKGKKNKTVPLDILLYAGNLAVYHSKARKNGQADLYYTQVKYLRRAKNGPKGLVLPTNEKNLFIKIDDAMMRKLDEYLIV